MDLKQTCRLDIKNMLEKLISNDNDKALISSIYDKLDSFELIDNYVIREQLKDQIADLQKQKAIEEKEIIEDVVSEDKIEGAKVKIDGKDYFLLKNKNGSYGPLISLNDGQDSIMQSAILVSAPDDPNAPTDTTVEPQAVQQPAPAEQQAEQTPEEQANTAEEPAPADTPPADDTTTDEQAPEENAEQNQQNDDLQQKTQEAIDKINTIDEIINNNFDKVPDLQMSTDMLVTQELFKDNLKEITDMDLNIDDETLKQEYITKCDEIIDKVQKQTESIEKELEEKYGLKINGDDSAVDKTSNETDSSEEPMSDGEPATESTMVEGAEDDGDIDDKIKTLRKEESDDAPSAEELDSALDGDNDFDFDDIDLDEGNIDNEFMYDDIDLDEDTNSNEDESVDIEKIEEAQDKTKEVEDLMKKLFDMVDDDDAEDVKEELEEKVEELKEVHEELKTNEENEENNEDEESELDDDEDDDIDFGDLDLDSLDEDKEDKEEKVAEEQEIPQLTEEQMTKVEIPGGGSSNAESAKYIKGEDDSLADEDENWDFDDIDVMDMESTEDESEPEEFDGQESTGNLEEKVDNLEEKVDEVVEKLEEVTGEDLDGDNEEGEDEEHKKKVKTDDDKEEDEDENDKGKDEEEEDKDKKDKNKKDDDDEEEEEEDDKKDKKDDELTESTKVGKSLSPKSSNGLQASKSYPVVEHDDKEKEYIVYAKDENDNEIYATRKDRIVKKLNDNCYFSGNEAKQMIKRMNAKCDSPKGATMWKKKKSKKESK